jgi:hypothetical protein
LPFLGLAGAWQIGRWARIPAARLNSQQICERRSTRLRGIPSANKKACAVTVTAGNQTAFFSGETEGNRENAILSLDYLTGRLQ